MQCGTVLVFSIFYIVASAQVTENSLRLLRQIYDYCASNDETYKCLKIQALKVVENALHARVLNITEGISIVGDFRQARLFKDETRWNETKINKLSSEEVNDLLVGATARFLNSRKLEVRVPKLVESARKKDKGKGGQAALLWALAIKGSFLAMAYNGIAVMAGTAIIVGKMALLLSAILGLKKLVSSNEEKTTLEIVKYPKYSEQHTHSSSYEDDGHYSRSFNVDENFGMRRTTKVA